MKKTRLYKFAVCAVVAVTLMSAIPVSRKDDDEKAKARVEKASAELRKFSEDKNLSYKELKEVALTLKGEKLSLKEKIALKLFRKKISDAAVAEASSQAAGSDGKSQVIALILCIFVGSLGVHRFYLGYTWQGIVQLLTLGLCGIWTLIDLIRIITGDLKPKNGEYGTTL